MGLDLTFDAESVAIADAVARFCATELGEGASRPGSAAFNQVSWKRLADLGVLALASESGAREYVHMAAACEALGRAGFPGPLAATFLATGLLPPAQAASVVNGSAIVSLGTPPLMPWGAVANLFVALDGERARLVEVHMAVPVQTLGGEHWARVQATPGEDLGLWAPRAPS